MKAIRVELFLLVYLISPAPGSAGPVGGRSSSPIALTPDEKLVCAVNEDSGSISLWDWGQGGEVTEIQVGEDPRTLAVSPEGRRICVANQRSQTLSIVDPAAGKVTATVDLGGQPFGVVLSDDGSRAFVSQYAGSYIAGKYHPGTIAVVHLARGSVEHSIPVKPKPWALAKVQGKPRLYVAHYVHLEGRGVVTEIDTRTFSVRREILLEEDRGTSGGKAGIFNGINSIAIHPDGSRALLTGMLHNARGGYDLNGRQLDHATIVQSALRVVDLDAGRELEAARMVPSLAGKPVAVPYAVAFIGAGRYFVDLFFASSDFKVLEYNEKGDAAGVAYCSVPQGPTGIVVTGDGKRAFIASRWDRSVSRISLENPREPRLLKTAKVTAEPWEEQRIRGAIIFHNTGDPRMAASRRISCVSCHLDCGLIPDAISWDLTVPGIQPKLSNTMDLSTTWASSPPFFHRGVFNAALSLEVFVRTFQGGSGFIPSLKAQDLERITNRTMGAYTIADELRASRIEPSPEWQAVLAFVNALRPRPNPHMNGSHPREEISGAVERGRKLFYSARQGCAICHKGPHLTDSKLDIGKKRKKNIYDVGTGKVLDVPALVNLWDTAPYLHDGRAATLKEVITIHNHDDWHGQTSHLAEGEINDLATFLLVAGEERNKKDPLLLNRSGAKKY